MMRYGPGSYLTSGNRYSQALGGNSQQQQQGRLGGNLSLSDAKSYYDTYQTLSGGPTSGDSLMNMFGLGGGGAAAGGATGLGPGATMTSMYGLPAAGSTSLAGTTGGSAAGAGAGAGAGALGILGPLSVLGLAAYFGYQEGEKNQAEDHARNAADPNYQAGQRFAEAHPDAFTAQGVSKDVQLGEIPHYGYAQWNPTTRRLEIDGMPVDAWGVKSDERHRRSDRSGD